MANNLDFQSIQQNLSDAKSVLILMPSNPSLDSVAASLALYLTLKKGEKNVGLGCPTPMPVAYNRLVGVDKISDKIGNRNLVVSFDYLKDSIEKVSYNIEDNKFNLVVEPKPNYPPLDSDKVSYSYTGASADIIFVIGAAKLENLGNLYAQEKKIFEDKLTVNIDNKSHNSRFGKINLQDTQASSCCEIIAALIKALGLALDEDIATNLFAGIKANTSNFQAVNVGASTFEVSAWCLQNGARKDQLGFSGPRPMSQFPASPFQNQSFFPSTPPNAFQSPVQTPVQPMVQEDNSPPLPFTKEPDKKEENKQKQPPPDWLKPKIYQGKNLS